VAMVAAAAAMVAAAAAVGDTEPFATAANPERETVTVCLSSDSV